MSPSGSLLLSLYVAVKLPLLLLLNAALVTVFNWIIGLLAGPQLRLAEIAMLMLSAIAAMTWTMLALLPAAALFTFTAYPHTATPEEARYAHNVLLCIHVALLGAAGIRGGAALMEGLSFLGDQSTKLLSTSLFLSYAFVGCQLAWILRPFVGSPFYSVEFLRANALERNFYEFLLFEVIPNIAGGL